MFSLWPTSNTTLPDSYWATFSLPDGKLPVVYSDSYNITFWGIEKLHPFDSQKYGRIAGFLTDWGVLDKTRLLEALPVSNDLINKYHSSKYILDLQSSRTLARITEVAPVALFPSAITNHKILLPMRSMVGGSLIAARAALERGWGINLGGGFHHAHSKGGGGFCVYADITMIAGELRRHSPIRKIMVVDLDAHQGNGQSRDLGDDPNTYLLDLYNAAVYPSDKEAIAKITHRVELESGMKDKEYLYLLRKALDKSLADFAPDFIIYNAGSDILAGDPLGALGISSEGLIERDEIVFRTAIDRKIPIVMLLSGGYQKINAEIIASSIRSMFAKGLLK